MIRQFIIVSVLFFNFYYASAQDDLLASQIESYDSIYYDKLENILTIKLFTAQKFSDFRLNDDLVKQSIQYNSEPGYLVGLGGSYNWLSIKLGVGTKNSDDSITESARRFDIQTQINLRKFTLSFYYGKNKGYYLSNPYNLLAGWGKEDIYIRRDIRNLTYGATGFYVFNSDRYSNRATFLQNEWQKKTAGSLLAGGSLIYNSIQADSSLIPTNIKDEALFHGVKFDRTEYYSAGVNLGYAFTLVLWKNWFFNYSILGGLSGGAASIYPINESKQHEFKLGVTLLNNLGFGFNSNKIYAGLNYSNLKAYSPLPIENSTFGMNIGKVQFLIAYRIPIKKHKNILPDWVPFQL